MLPFFKILRHPRSAWRRLKPWIIRPRRLVFLFGTPAHSNLGDQAQSYCIELWLHENFPNYGIRTFTLPSSTNQVFNDLRFFIRKHDMIICHSGYHMTDLYDERIPYMKLASNFTDHKIVIFPQTINFTDIHKLEETANCFNSHGNVVLMCRDEVSYKTAKQYFDNCKLLLMPDIVTSLIGTKFTNNSRNGVLFCVRNDIEAFYSKQQIEKLRNRFVGVRTEITDTTLQIPWQEIAADRALVLDNIINSYSKYKVVITDRYHGTIISLIAGTPVVVIGSKDHKLSSGVKWFPNSYSQYVQFAENLDEAYKMASAILEDNKYEYRLAPYFKERYYDNLKQQII